MTDFFDRLAMKVLGRGTVLEPVILTPFEEGGDMPSPVIVQEPAAASRDAGAFSGVSSASPGAPSFSEADTSSLLDGRRGHFSGDTPPVPSPGKRGCATDVCDGRKAETPQRKEQKGDTSKVESRDNKRPATGPSDLLSSGSGSLDPGRPLPMGPDGEDRDGRRDGFSATTSPGMVSPAAASSLDTVPFSAETVSSDSALVAATKGDDDRTPPAGLRPIRLDRYGAATTSSPGEKKASPTHHDGLSDGARLSVRDGRRGDAPVRGMNDLPGRAKVEGAKFLDATPQRDSAPPGSATRHVPVGDPGTSRVFLPSPPDGDRQSSPGSGKMGHREKTPSGRNDGAFSQASSSPFSPIPSSVLPGVSREHGGRGSLFPQVRENSGHARGESDGVPLGAAIPLSSPGTGRTTQIQSQDRGAATDDGAEGGRYEVEIRIDRIDVRERGTRAGKALDALSHGPSLTVDAYIVRRQGRSSSGGTHE